MLEIIQPHLLEIFGLFITAIISLAAAQFRVWTGVQIDEKHLRALHSAILTGAEDAIGGGFEPEMAVQKAIAYAHASVPDAIHALNPSGGVLNTLATRYAQQALRRFAVP